MPVPTEQILKAILDYAPENIVLMDRDHKVICYNERIRHTLFDYHGRYIQVGDDYRDFVVEMAMTTYLKAFEKALKGEITEIDFETVAESFRLWFHYRVNPVYDANSELLGVSLSAEDITQRKLAQEELQESETKFRTLVEQSLISVFILKDNRFIYTNPAFRRMLGIDKNEPEWAYTVADFVHEDDLERFYESCQKVLNGTQPTEHLLLSAIRADGALRFLEIDISLIPYNGHSALLGSALDITDRIDEEIRISEAVDRGQELERTQIGMELHDNVKQQLVAIGLNLQVFKDMLPDSQAGLPILNKSIDYVQQAVNEIRKLSHRLAPAVDEETPMLDKITDLIKRMNVKGELEVTIEIDDSYALSDQLQLVLYRIIQEHFSNIIKYAQASHVLISVNKKAKNLIVVIADDGIGFNLSEKMKGVGLQNIHLRVQLLGGSIQIQSAPGEGFRLVVSIPL